MIRWRATGKTPTGVFSIDKASGIFNNLDTKLNYVQINESHYYVDDVNSKYYNKLVNINDVALDWKSAEHLCEYTEEYKYAMIVNYNEECIPGKGSAIFLHCSSKEYTGGCISIKDENMVKLMNMVPSNLAIWIDSNNMKI